LAVYYKALVYEQRDIFGRVSANSLVLLMKVFIVVEGYYYLA